MKKDIQTIIARLGSKGQRVDDEFNVINKQAEYIKELEQKLEIANEYLLNLNKYKEYIDQYTFSDHKTTEYMLLMKTIDLISLDTTKEN